MTRYPIFLPFITLALVSGCALPKAPPPVAQELRGEVGGIRWGANSFRLRVPHTDAPVRIHWDGDTRFIEEGVQLGPEALAGRDGQTIAVLVVQLGKKRIANQVALPGARPHPPLAEVTPSASAGQVSNEIPMSGELEPPRL